MPSLTKFRNDRDFFSLVSPIGEVWANGSGVCAQPGVWSGFVEIGVPTTEQHEDLVRHGGGRLSREFAELPDVDFSKNTCLASIFWGDVSTLIRDRSAREQDHGAGRLASPGFC